MLSLNNIIKTENIVPLSNGIIVDIFDLDIFGLRKIKKVETKWRRTKQNDVLAMVTLTNRDRKYRAFVK